MKKLSITWSFAIWFSIAGMLIVPQSTHAQGASEAKPASYAVAYIITVPADSAAVEYTVEGKLFTIAPGETREVRTEVNDIKLTKGSTLKVKVVNPLGEIVLLDYLVTEDINVASFSHSVFASNKKVIKLQAVSLTHKNGTKEVSGSLSKYGANGFNLGFSEIQRLREFPQTDGN